MGKGGFVSVEEQWSIDSSSGGKVLCDYLCWADVSMRLTNVDEDTLVEGVRLALLNVNMDERRGGLVIDGYATEGQVGRGIKF